MDGHSQVSIQHPEVITQASTPLVPTSREALNIPYAVVEDLLLKHLSTTSKTDLLHLTRLMGISGHIVENLVTTLRQKSLVEVYQAESISEDTTSISSAKVRYGLSAAGMQQARLAFKRDAYIGPTPVSLADYNQMVLAQDARAFPITRKDVVNAMADVYGADRMIDVLGPAINSGRALLLYGDAGTGKTFVATRLNDALNTAIYIPYAVYSDGNIIKLFSKQHHTPIATAERDTVLNYKSQFDKRWVLCERPSIQVGGELTMDMLEVNHSENSRVWMAPLQMMANNGVLIIDDLGRQKMPVDSILNRWIVPMEYSVDHLSLPNGQQETIPFILTLAFSTNLDPEKISDPAFLRRLGYKIIFRPLPQNEYHALWSEMAKNKALTIQDEAFECLYRLHKNHNVGFLPCLPKDLLGICRDIVVFEQSPYEINSEILQRAWEVYFTADGTGGGAR